MRKYRLIIFSLLLLPLSCNNEPQIVKEPWIDKPVSEWPDFALTNKISFADTTYTDIANSFLVNTGIDTIGATCKHLFMVFEKQLGINNIDLGVDFKYWDLYPKIKKEKTVSIKRLINRNSSEKIGQFNTLKVRDWIIFEINDLNAELYPLKIRFKPVKTNEVVYAVGSGIKQQDNSKPELIKLKCIDNLGDYFYIKPIKTDAHPNGRSGSPVIDKNGYLVGIVSGQEGNLGVISSVNYLKKIFDKYNVKYEKPSH